MASRSESGPRTPWHGTIVTMWPRIDELRALELGDPGGIRGRLSDLVLRGDKRATAGLLVEDYEAEGEAPETVGERLVLVDGDGLRLAVVEVTRVEHRRFGDVDWGFVQAENEGDASVKQWRSGHQRFWASQSTPVTMDTELVLTWFELVTDDP